MPVVKSIRTLKGAGVLEDRTSRSVALDFKKYNLVYGFNGSGKSTLSRVFASLQRGEIHPKLPEGCAIQLDLDDGKTCKFPEALHGMDRRILVFNADFVAENLQWNRAFASPVFYIGRSQAAAAAELLVEEQKLPAAIEKAKGAKALAEVQSKALAKFKTDTARDVAQALRMQGRKYEAPQLVDDFARLDLGDSAALTDQQFDAAKATSGLASPPSKLNDLPDKNFEFGELITFARAKAQQTVGSAVLAEIEAHPTMSAWIIEGAHYHADNGLGSCLLCGQPLTDVRKAALKSAIDGEYGKFIADLERLGRALVERKQDLGQLVEMLPASDAVMSDMREDFRHARNSLVDALAAAVAILEKAAGVIADKANCPNVAVDVPALPAAVDLDKAAAALQEGLKAFAALLARHNESVDAFERHQAETRISIRRHMLRKLNADFRAQTTASSEATSKQAEADNAREAIVANIARLKAAVQEHGSAADQINALVRNYLGHGELSIVATAEGYQIRRFGKSIEGEPSEGEKTAIALCYFLSTLESEGRKTKDLVVVIDDPISSLDTRALNYACTLLRTRLSGVSQIFVLTHNLHCLNEFKKAWARYHKPRNDNTAPTATFLFIDVKMAADGTRSSCLVPLSALLREYDSEYHYLFKHLLDFAQQGAGYPYAYMMPNVLRRVLDTFLAFRLPGSSGLTGKIEQLCAQHPTLDAAKMGALERLTQVESHSDNIDDLISFSSMTVEETLDAAKIMLAMMAEVDKPHLDGETRLCR